MASGISTGRGTASDRGTDGTFSRTPTERRSTETKASFKTTEFISYVTVLVGILIAGAVVDADNASGMGARQVWLFATILTVGYMVSRGLAKAGSRDPYTHERSDH